MKSFSRTPTALVCTLALAAIVLAGLAGADDPPQADPAIEADGEPADAVGRDLTITEGDADVTAEEPAKPTDELRERCHAIVAALPRGPVTDEQLDQGYLQPFWRIVDQETRDQWQQPEAVFIIAVGQFVEEQANKGAAAGGVDQRQGLFKE